MLRLSGSPSYVTDAAVQFAIGVCEPGAPKSTGTGYYGVHILTPETAATTHYHFAAIRFNPPPRSRADDLELREKITAGRRYAFEIQDKPVLEAQQRRVSRTGGTRRPALLSVDAGPVRVQRVLAAIIDAERPELPPLRPLARV